MKTTKQIQLMIIALVICSVKVANAQSRWSIDVTGGTPTMMTNAQPLVTPYGGGAVRFAVNKVVSLQGQLNAGAIGGKDFGHYFRNNFIYYGLRANVNITPFSKPGFLEKFNAYVYGGTGFMDLYRSVGAEYGTRLSGTSNSYYVSTAGINIRYYCNEMLDFIGGTDLNFTQTKDIDLDASGSDDKFLMSYVGISIKLLPRQRKQHVDWASVKLPYVTDPVTKEVHHITRVESKEILVKDVAVDSISALFAERITGVDSRLDTINVVLAELIRMMQNNVKTNNTQPAPQPAAPSFVSNVPAPSVPVVSGSIARTNHVGNTQETAPASNSFVSKEPEAAVAKVSKGPSASEVRFASYSQPVNAAPAKAVSPEIETGETFEAAMSRKNSVVIGSFINESNAVRLKSMIISKGYQSKIYNNGGHNRVVVFPEKETNAESLLKELRLSVNSEAWLLKSEK